MSASSNHCTSSVRQRLSNRLKSVSRQKLNEEPGRSAASLVELVAAILKPPTESPEAAETKALAAKALGQMNRRAAFLKIASRSPEVVERLGEALFYTTAGELGGVACAPYVQS